MYPDIIFNFIQTSPSGWAGIGLLFAIFDYIFNIVMCFFVGGIQNIRKSNKKSSFKQRQKNFVLGGREWIKEFQSDSLSWFWPLTILGLPIALYGITRIVVSEALTSLSEISTTVTHYYVFPSVEYIQFFPWLISILVSLTTIYRYRKQRSKPTFFSKSQFFTVIRVILFNIPIGFAIVSVILFLISFSTSLYGFLLDPGITYNTFNPDQLYGLKKAYDTVVFMGVILIIISFLPTVMLIRESKEKYNSLYKLGTYVGILSSFIIFSILIFQFNFRIGEIKDAAYHVSLLSSINSYSLNQNGNGNLLTALLYFNTLKDLPGSFPVPLWLGSIVSIRTIILGYELSIIVTSKDENKPISEKVKTIIAKLK